MTNQRIVYCIPSCSLISNTVTSFHAQFFITTKKEGLVYNGMTIHLPICSENYGCGLVTKDKNGVLEPWDNTNTLQVSAWYEASNSLSTCTP